MPVHIQGRVKLRRLEKARPVRVDLRRVSGSLRALPDAPGIALRPAPAIHPGAVSTTPVQTQRDTL